MTHYSRPQVVFKNLKSWHVLIFEKDHDGLEKNLQLFGFVSTKQNGVFYLAPRELNHEHSHPKTTLPLNTLTL